MTRNFTDAYIYGWRPDEYDGFRGNASYVIPPDDIEFLDITQRAGDLKDVGSVGIFNPNGKYSGGSAERIHPAETTTDTGEAEGYTGAYGSGPYGEGLYQPVFDAEDLEDVNVEHGDRIDYYIGRDGDDVTHQWTGVVRSYTVSSDGANVFHLDFEVEDFAYAVMSMRRVTNAWDDERICTGPGNGQGIINTILANECPELDLSELPEIPERTSITLGDENVLESIVELVNRAGLLLYADADTVRMEAPRSIRTEFTLSPDDYKLLEYESNDDTLYNDVRVEGGTAYDLHHEQTTRDGWTTVTSDDRHHEQLSIRKSEIDRLELWTDPTLSQSGEGIIVRLQADDGGEPVEPAETRSDIARRKLASEFLEHDGWTTFLLPDHNLPGTEPWLIVESDGEIGQDIGIRTVDDALTLRSYYPYPIRVSRQDAGSQSEYRRREDTLTDGSVSSLDEGRDRATAYLSRKSLPDIELSFDADSDRMHELKPGQVIRANVGELDVNGRYVCVERGLSWDGGTEDCAITLRNIDSL